MKFYISILLFTCFNILFSQNKVLKDFDFQKRKYKFFFYESYNGQKSKDSIKKPFVITDIKKLEALKSSWIGNNEATEIADCGFDYNIYIIEEDSLVSNLSVNTVCGHINASGKGTSFDFTPYNPFENLIKDSEVYSAFFSSDSIKNSRELYILLKNQENIYCRSIKYDNWVNYDGQFYFNIYSKDEIIGLKNRNEVINDLYNKFNKNDVFINYSSTSKNSLSGYIYCSKAFYEELKNNIPIWDDLEFTLSEIGIWNPWHKVYNRNIYYTTVFTDNREKLEELIVQVKKIENVKIETTLKK